jgi:hypothetical protein
MLVTIEYYDTTSSNPLAFQYEGLSASTTDAVGTAYMFGDRQWKLYSYYLTDGKFTNGINGSDCRVNLMGSKKAFIHRIFIGAVDGGLAPYTPPVGVNEASTQMPYVFDLSPNYPNPFNPSTTINYSLAKEGLATLKVYNLLGQEVATLVNTVKQAGNYSIQWNASSFSTGVYFYRLTQNDNVKVQKLVLMK